MEEKFLFNAKEYVLCVTGTSILDAKCLKRRLLNEQKWYFVHYAGNQKNNEWVIEARLLKLTEHNMRIQMEIMRNCTADKKTEIDRSISTILAEPMNAEKNANCYDKIFAYSTQLDNYDRNNSLKKLDNAANNSEETQIANYSPLNALYEMTTRFNATDDTTTNVTISNGQTKTTKHSLIPSSASYNTINHFQVTNKNALKSTVEIVTCTQHKVSANAVNSSKSNLRRYRMKRWFSLESIRNVSRDSFFFARKIMRSKSNAKNYTNAAYIGRQSRNNKQFNKQAIEKLSLRGNHMEQNFVHKKFGQKYKRDANLNQKSVKLSPDNGITLLN